jgi:hypothetical protein
MHADVSWVCFLSTTAVYCSAVIFAQQQQQNVLIGQPTPKMAIIVF